MVVEGGMVEKLDCIGVVFENILNNMDVTEDITGWGDRHIDLLTKNGTMKLLKTPTAVDDVHDVKTSYPLIPGGVSEELTNQNQLRYLDLWLQHKLEREIEEQTRWFVEGLTTVVPSSVLNLFSPHQLQTLMGGTALDDDALPDLFAHIQYTNYAPSKRAAVKQDFEMALRDMTAKERQTLFRFVTSLDRIPPGGCGSLSPPFTIELDTRKFKTMMHMPESQTCMNHLLMPKYTDWKMLKERLIQASSNGMEYHLPYG